MPDDDSVSISVDLSGAQYSRLEELAANEDTDVSTLLIRGADMFIATYSRGNMDIPLTPSKQKQIIEMLVLILRLVSQILYYCSFRLQMGALPPGSMPQKGRQAVWDNSRKFAESLLTEPGKLEV